MSLEMIIEELTWRIKVKFFSAEKWVDDYLENGGTLENLMSDMNFIVLVKGDKTNEIEDMIYDEVHRRLPRMRY